MNEVYLKNYLKRIRLQRKIIPYLNTLTLLQKHHLLNIPFENLDIHQGIPIIINVDNFYKKIIINKRGGFCYELNGLFNELLKALEFNTYIVSARVFNTNGNYGEEFDHLAIIVLLDNEKWLTDVGFGEFSFSPLKIKIGIEQKDERGIFRIIRFNEEYYAVQKKTSPGWKNEYLFSLKPRTLSEFSEMCRYHQTSPRSSFTQKKICSIATSTGRITLTDNSLKITNNRKAKETAISKENQFFELLKKYFDIEL